MYNGALKYQVAVARIPAWLCMRHRPSSARSVKKVSPTVAAYPSSAPL